MRALQRFIRKRRGHAAIERAALRPILGRIDGKALPFRSKSGDDIGYSPTGEVFNLLWEDVAESVAASLRAEKLILYVDELPTDKRGQPISAMTAKEVEQHIARGSLKPDMHRAFTRGARALAGGVGRVHLVSRRVPGATLLELFTHAGVGTMITAAAVDKLRPARIEDVQGIIALIEPLEADGTLVKRSREALEREIGNFLVVEHDGMIRGCAALYPYPEAKSAEFACLAVAADHRESGAGEELLLACEERARAMRIRKLFALTTRASHWFLEQGFKPAAVAKLPEQRQQLYNWKRGSKVFLKKL